MPLLPYLHRVVEGANLSLDEARRAADVLFSGQASAVQISSFLTALRMKGETPEELAGFALSMREHMIVVDAGPVVDNCGTGGDSSGTFNVSTTASFVLAGAGAKVAKHGNRSISSKTGAADVLEALGVGITATALQAAEQIREIGIAFLFAPAFHPAMRHVQPIRRELKLRTIFNVLGPLANPASAQRQVIGVASLDAARRVADAVALLGAEHVFVVHGHGNVDEITTTGPTEVFEVRGSKVKHLTWTPESFRVPVAELASLRGGDATYSASIIMDVLSGQMGPRRDIVLVNSAAGLVAAGLVADLREGVERAAHSIDSGAALQKLNLLRAAATVA